MYNIGKASSPVLVILVTLCNGFLAYQTKDDTSLVHGLVSSSTLYATAALWILCIILFTVLYMEPVVNLKLLELGSQVEKGVKAKDLGTNEKDVREMLARWKGLNFVRAAIVGSGALLTASATFY